ncbi:DUF2058 domain-containing protein [Halochromatium glycolicum]|jgi:hypothetical protein|uniref:Nucleoprotein/polynucleotide-associated enzyme n=1 Tax=Halochromatium glycolicum TaxID=85075 RepID=A0AAJ0U9K5_9GAMM|nr:DUF2058 domain-containing protein [Halochromatium glycolicum]MBK1706797.1 nucleoprotein/polynucleotide-associated enzyme [Halochromatium glycolicum]
MAGSLQEQLVKAGLASEQQLKQTKSKKRKQKRAGGDSAGAAQRRQAEQAAAEKRQRDQELNRKRDEEAKRKAEEIALWQLVRDHRIPRSDGDTAYNFSDGKALKRLYVSAEQHRDLVAGKTAIVRHDDFYELVPAAVAERIAEVDAAAVLVHNRDNPDEGDDEYAEYKVPDDLMW